MIKVLNVLKTAFIKWRQRLESKRLMHCGTGVEINYSVTTVFPERISIGNHTYIGPRSYMNGRGGLQIGDHSILGPETVIMSSTHNYRLAMMIPYDEVELLKPVVIERCTWVGMRAIIMPGVKLGEGSIVGAGSVVTKSFPPGSIIAGNPAKIIDHRDMEQYYKCVESNAFYLLMKQRKQFSKVEKYFQKEG